MFKINIGTKDGSTYKLETEAEALIGKSLHEKVEGKDVSPDLEGYEFEITGASDKAGFTAIKDVEGIGLKKILLTFGKAFKKRPKKEGKRKRSENNPKGLRMRKTVCGKVISPEIIQINLKLIKQGNKKLSEIFPDQNKMQATESPTSPKQSEDSSTKPEPEVKPEEQKPAEKSQEKIEEKPIKESTPEISEPKEEVTKSKEKSQDKEIAQPDKEPTSGEPVEEKKE